MFRSDVGKEFHIDRSGLFWLVGALYGDRDCNNIDIDITSAIRQHTLHVVQHRYAASSRRGTSDWLHIYRRDKILFLSMCRALEDNFNSYVATGCVEHSKFSSWQVGYRLYCRPESVYATRFASSVRVVSISNIVISILITGVEEALNVVKMMRLAVVVSLIVAGNSFTSVHSLAIIFHKIMLSIITVQK